MRKGWLPMLMLVTGCVAPYDGHMRYSIGVPVAVADGGAPVYLRNDAKAFADGNTYLIEYIAMTNCNSNATNDQQVQQYNADLATNRWPYKRMHMDLSLDGGTTFAHRIGYGVQPGGPFGEFWWSPPEDYDLLSTNAVIRLCTLDGGPLLLPTNGAPYDTLPSTYLESGRFIIAGAQIQSPADGDLYYSGFPCTVTWRQAGGGPIMTLYWLTPSTEDAVLDHVIQVFSNCVDGINSREINLDFPPAETVKLVIRSHHDPNVIGYSGIFMLEP